MKAIKSLILVNTIFLLAFILIGYKISQVKSFEIVRYTVPRGGPISDESRMLFHAPSILAKYPSSAFISISFTGNKEDDDKKMEFIRYKSRELEYTYDSLHVLRIHLPSALPYGRFIELLRSLLSDNHKRYFEYNNHFYIFGNSSSCEKEEEIQTLYI